MQVKRKTGLGQNNIKSRLFYIALFALPTLQFLIFYVFVNFNSFLLAFREYKTDLVSDGYIFPTMINFSHWFTHADKVELLAAIKISLKSYAIQVVVSVPLGLFFSYYMFKKMPGSKTFRILLFMPSIISAAVLAIVYQYVVNFPIKEWFSNPKLDTNNIDNRYFFLIFFNLFVGFGTNVLMYTNKMGGIAPEIIESAHLDGANGFNEFWYIVLPQTYSIATVFWITGFAACFSNQWNLMLFQKFSPTTDMQPVGYLLWYGVERAHGNVAAMTLYAALGLLITFVVVPLTFLLRWALNKVGWKED